MDLLEAHVHVCCQTFGIPYNTLHREKIREIAGNITPAIVMTSAIAAGFVALNLYEVRTKSTRLYWRFYRHIIVEYTNYTSDR
jgi:hypothetical protein